MVECTLLSKVTGSEYCSISTASVIAGVTLICYARFTQDTFFDHLMSPVSSSYHTLEIELVLSSNIYRDYLIVNYIKYIIKAFVNKIIYTINNSN